MKSFNITIQGTSQHDDGTLFSTLVRFTDSLAELGVVVAFAALTRGEAITRNTAAKPDYEAPAKE